MRYVTHITVLTTTKIVVYYKVSTNNAKLNRGKEYYRKIKRQVVRPWEVDKNTFDLLY